MDIPVRPRQRPAFGSLLKHWRLDRRISQLALATAAGISGRHLCFLETGRAQPSREMVQLLSSVLDVPLTEQNALLMAAGYAPIYGERELGAPELDHVRRALDFILRQQEPYPAIVADGHWDVVMKNAACDRLFGLFKSPIRPEFARNAMHTVFDPNGLRPFIVNWEEVAGHSMQTLHREAATNPAAARLRDEMLAYPDVPSQWRFLDPDVPVLPLITLKLKKDDVALAFFSTVTTFATPRDITLQQLRIECFYPADTATEEAARRVAAKEDLLWSCITES
jgi:transcriptional regulator with XRE-family HTH domain